MEKRAKDPSDLSKSRSVSAIANHIALNAILAASTQVAAPVKPGNVHRYHDFKVTKMEHYLSSAISLNTPMSQMATRGIMVERGLIDIDEVDMGWIIGEAAKDGGKWHHGGITNLGMLFLFSPLAAAAGHLISASPSIVEYSLDLADLPSISVDFVENTTPEDTVNIFTSLYKIKTEIYPMSNSIGVSLPESITDLLEEEINLLEFFKLNAKKNLVFQEISYGYQLCFKEGLSAFQEVINEGEPMVNAISHTFLTLLSLNPDSMIYQKHGRDVAVKIQNKARNIIEEGGYLTNEGKQRSLELDNELQQDPRGINPGTTADLTSCVTFIATLSGIRP